MESLLQKARQNIKDAESKRLESYANFIKTFKNVVEDEKGKLYQDIIIRSKNEANSLVIYFTDYPILHSSLQEALSHGKGINDMNANLPRASETEFGLSIDIDGSSVIMRIIW